MPERTARLRGKVEDPPEAEYDRHHTHAMPAFLRPETHEPDARDDPLPEWTRPPVDWREEHDLVAGHMQQYGLAPPGAPGPDNPSALRLKLPGPHAAAQRVEPGTTHDDRAWIRRSHLLTPREDGGWNVYQHQKSHLIGTITRTNDQVELRRADHWSTLLAGVPQSDDREFLEPPLLGRTLGLAYLVFNARWPAGPPRVRLPDEYTRPKKAAPAPETPAAAGGSRRR